MMTSWIPSGIHGSSEVGGEEVACCSEDDPADVDASFALVVGAILERMVVLRKMPAVVCYRPERGYKYA